MLPAWTPSESSGQRNSDFLTLHIPSAIRTAWLCLPRPVKALGIAPYDERDDLLTAESDAASFTRTFSDVRAEKQERFRVRLGTFMVNFDGASKGALAFVTED